MGRLRNALLVALLVAVSIPAVAAAEGNTTSPSSDHSAFAQILAAGILIVVTGLGAWFGKRRFALTKRTIGIDFAAGVTLSKEDWERIPQTQRTAWQKDTDYKVDTVPAVTTFTALKDLTKPDDETVAANTKLSEE